MASSRLLLCTDMVFEDGIVCSGGTGPKGTAPLGVSSEEEHISAEYVLQTVSAWRWVVPPPYLCSGNANF